MAEGAEGEEGHAEVDEGEPGLADNLEYGVALGLSVVAALEYGVAAVGGGGVDGGGKFCGVGKEVAGVLAWTGVVVVVVDVEVCELEGEGKGDVVAVGGVGGILGPVGGEHEFGACDVGGSPVCSVDDEEYAEVYGGEGPGLVVLDGLVYGEYEGSLEYEEVEGEEDGGVEGKAEGSFEGEGESADDELYDGAVGGGELPHVGGVAVACGYGYDGGEMAEGKEEGGRRFEGHVFLFGCCLVV